VTDTTFLYNLKRYNKSIKRIELNGWKELEDIRCLIECTPALTWLDVGKKGLGQTARDKSTAVATNLGEWAAVLSELPYLTAFHGVKFFYEVSAQAAVPSVTATSTNISMTDRSRVRKNDEVAGVLAWKCGRLRRVDHWEEGTGKVIILVRDGERMNDKDKVRWEVRRVKV
jgi:homoserine dehydrogenase